MAPIQEFGSYATQSSLFNMTPTACKCGGISIDSSEWGLPIARRGNFFHDSFFENVRTYFDAAVQDMLSKWGEMDTASDIWHSNTPSLVTNLSRYRQLRSRSSQKENQASTVVSGNRTHKIVLDVHDFMDGDLKVKVVSEKEVLVEGSGKAALGDGSVSSRGFCQRFSFPSSVNMAEITSVLSSDGVLTIEAPKLEGKDIPVCHESSAKTSANIKVDNSSSTSASSNACISSVSADSVRQDDKNDTVYYCKGCNKKIGAWQKAPESKLAQQEGQKVPIKINASLTKKHHNIAINTEAQNSEFKNETQSKDIKVGLTEQKQRISEQDKREAVTQKNSSEQSKTIGRETQLQTQSSTNKNSYEIPVTTQFSTLPIVRRGPFFSDSFFKDIQKDFESAVQEVLSKWGTRSSFMDDDLSTYRNLRLCDLKEETQAVKSTEDDSSHKIVLDVQDFMNGGEVTVKAISDREIVIEGQVEKEENGSKSVKRFSKRFNLPGDIRLDSVTSVMSSDGVLTITAPKKPSSIQLREVIIPVSIEGKEEHSENYNKTEDIHQNSHASSSSSNTKKSSELNNSVFLANSNSPSNANQGVISKQAKNVKEHIIPVNVEGSYNDTNTKVINHQIKVEKECNDSHSENSQQQTQKSHIIPINVEGSYNGTNANVINHQIKVEKECNNSHSENSQQQKQKSHIIPINVEGSYNGTTAKVSNHQIKVEKECNDSHAENSQQQTQKSQETIKPHQMSTTKENAHSKVMQEKSDSTFKQDNSYKFAQLQKQAASKEEKHLKSYTDNESLASSASTKRYLPITRRGLFFDDTFFQSYQKDFQAAVKDVLIKSRQFVDTTDNMTAYRSLRQRDLKVENQALHVQEDQESLKIVVDAKDFVNGDITVSVDGEELVIEGRAENSEARSSNSLTFSHRFLLPEFADISTITSAISSDGILTVDSPKNGNPGADAVRRMSSEAKSKNESHSDGGHKWEQKRVKESSEQSNGFSSRTYSSNYNSRQQQSSTF